MRRCFVVVVLSVVLLCKCSRGQESAVASSATSPLSAKGRGARGSRAPKLKTNAAAQCCAQFAISGLEGTVQDKRMGGPYTRVVHTFKLDGIDEFAYQTQDGTWVLGPMSESDESAGVASVTAPLCPSKDVQRIKVQWFDSVEWTTGDVVLSCLSGEPSMLVAAPKNETSPEGLTHRHFWEKVFNKAERVTAEVVASAFDCTTDQASQLLQAPGMEFDNGVSTLRLASMLDTNLDGYITADEIITAVDVTPAHIASVAAAFGHPERVRNSNVPAQTGSGGADGTPADVRGEGALADQGGTTSSADSSAEVVSGPADTPGMVVASGSANAVSVLKDRLASSLAAQATPPSPQTQVNAEGKVVSEASWWVQEDEAENQASKFMDYSMTEQQLLSWCTRSVSQATVKAQELQQHDMTKARVLSISNDIAMLLDAPQSWSSLMAEVHPDKAMRDAAQNCEEKITAIMAELGSNHEHYEVVRSVSDQVSEDPVDEYMFKKLLTMYKDGGAGIADEAGRKRCAALMVELQQLNQNFSSNINDDKKYMTRKVNDVEALMGLPIEFVASHTKDGEVKFSTDSPDADPIMRYGSNESLRKEMAILQSSRAHPANLDILKRVLTKRWELAKLLGYASWADYVTSDMMSGSAARVRQFLKDVREIAAVRTKKELQMMAMTARTLRSEHVKYLNWRAKSNNVQLEEFTTSNGENKNSKPAPAPAAALAASKEPQQNPETSKAPPKAAVLLDNDGLPGVHSYDYQFLENKVRERRYGSKSSDLSFLRYPIVRDGIMWLCEELFGVTFVRIHPPTWHGDVEVFRVISSSAQNRGKLMGRIALDMHPRDNKFFHAAQFPIQHGVAKTLPEGALVCNFPKGDVPMELDQARTFLHEFGHLLHHIIGGQSQKFVLLSGVSNEHDFVEVPSTLLEEWVVDAQTLRRLAGSKITIADKVISRLKQAEKFGVGVETTRSAYLAELSLSLHDKDPSTFEPKQLDESLSKSKSPFKHVKEIQRLTAFGHLMDYSAVYYTYLWSTSYARHLFQPFLARGLMDKTTARRYTELVLRPGGSKPADTLVEDFSGHHFNMTAFKRYMAPAISRSSFRRWWMEPQKVPRP